MCAKLYHTIRARVKGYMIDFLNKVHWKIQSSKARQPCKRWYNKPMNTQDKIYAVWAMNGAYYDAIMNSIPNWVTDDIIDDWFYSQLGI